MNARIPTQALNAPQVLSEVSQAWDSRIVSELSDYIAIPAKSPMFDADWAANGFIDTVVRNTATWIEAQRVPGLTLEIVRLPGQTPVLFFEVAATRSNAQQTVLMYGHLDKQPEFSGWRSDLGPWTP
jgi:acetylornithine deacetylase/succinyl-diaminopimelate desuccinylase-like protein